MSQSAYTPPRKLRRASSRLSNRDFCPPISPPMRDHGFPLYTVTDGDALEGRTCLGARPSPCWGAAARPAESAGSAPDPRWTPWAALGPGSARPRLRASSSRPGTPCSPSPARSTAPWPPSPLRRRRARPSRARRTWSPAAPRKRAESRNAMGDEMASVGGSRSFRAAQVLWFLAEQLQQRIEWRARLDKKAGPCLAPPNQTGEYMCNKCLSCSLVNYLSPVLPGCGTTTSGCYVPSAFSSWRWPRPITRRETGQALCVDLFDC